MRKGFQFALQAVIFFVGLLMLIGGQTETAIFLMIFSVILFIRTMFGYGAGSSSTGGGGGGCGGGCGGGGCGGCGG